MASLGRLRFMALLAVTTVVFLATPAVAATSGTGSPSGTSGGTTTTTTSSSGYHPWPAVLILIFAALLVVASLGFIYLYHRRLLNSIDQALAEGQTVGTVDDSIGVQGFRANVATDSGIAIAGPADAVAGKPTKFSSTGIPAGATISWTVEGVEADPTTATTADFTTTFKASGAATVKLAVTGQPAVAPLSVAVKNAATTTTPSVVFPFAVRNWGRLVVVIFGAGLIGALMVLNVISGEGGIGILGALFGVGAATATHDPPAQGGSQNGAAGAN